MSVTTDRRPCPSQLRDLPGRPRVCLPTGVHKSINGDVAVSSRRLLAHPASHTRRAIPRMHFDLGSLDPPGAPVRAVSFLGLQHFFRYHAGVRSNGDGGSVHHLACKLFARALRARSTEATREASRRVPSSVSRGGTSPKSSERLVRHARARIPNDVRAREGDYFVGSRAPQTQGR